MKIIATLCAGAALCLSGAAIAQDNSSMGSMNSSSSMSGKKMHHKKSHTKSSPSATNGSDPNGATGTGAGSMNGTPSTGDTMGSTTTPPNSSTPQ